MKKLIFAGRDLRAICPEIKFTQEFLSFIKNTTIMIITKTMKSLWTTYDIPAKMKCLAELEEKSTTNEAWRPTTGKVNLNPIIAKNLLTKKAELIGKIKLVREESAEIEQFFKGFSDQINAQLEEIDSLEKKYANN